MVRLPLDIALPCSHSDKVGWLIPFSTNGKQYIFQENPGSYVHDYISLFDSQIHGGKTRPVHLLEAGTATSVNRCTCPRVVHEY